MPRTIRALLSLGATALQKSGIGSGIERWRHEARLLLEKASGLSRPQMIGDPDRLLPDDTVQRYQLLLEGRIQNRLPLSRLLGEREFWSLPFAISSATLDPRPDSETLVEGVLSHLSDPDRPLRLVDLGTGSGCLLLALLTELKNAQGVGLDLSFEALVTARYNAEKLGLGERSHFVQMNWMAALRGTFDLLISNPPYIPEKEVETLAPEVRLHDPYHALTPGPEGLEAYRILAPQLRSHLNARGLCAVEVGQGQHGAVQALFENNDLCLREWRKDLSGIERCGLFMPCP